VVVAGMVASVRHLFTREGNPFASAILEDLDGQIEVMVWPKVYAETSDLWQEGNILLVEGKVRMSVRDDRVQLSCEKVRRYQPAAEEEKEVITAPPVTAPPVAEEPATDTAPVVAEEPATDTAPVVAEEPATDTALHESRRLVVNLKQTDDENRDKANLHKLIDLLRDFPGQDEVRLNVTNGEKIVNLRLYNIHTNYCPELHERLVELVGEDEIKMERYRGER